MGIYAARAEIEDSAVQLNMDCPYIFIATGIYTDEDLELRNSDLAVNIHTGGTVTGVTPEGTLRAENTAVNVAVAAYDDFSDEDDCICYGILCKDFDLTITDPAVEVRSFADGGMALGCNLDDVEDDFAEYEEGYQGTLVTLNGNTVCRTPANAVINLGNVQQGDESYRYYIHVETYYDALDTSVPAAEVVFGA